MLRKILAQSILLAGIAGSAAASVVVNIAETDSGVVSSYSGNLVLDSSSLATYYSEFHGTRSAIPAYYNLSDSYGVFRYESGDDSWSTGNSGNIHATTHSGTIFGWRNDSNERVYIDSNYVSGSFFSGMMDWAGESLASLGLVAGTYEAVRFANGETVTLNIAPTPVPLPAGLPLMGLALGSLMLLRRRS